MLSHHSQYNKSHLSNPNSRGFFLLFIVHHHNSICVILLVSETVVK